MEAIQLTGTPLTATGTPLPMSYRLTVDTGGGYGGGASVRLAEDKGFYQFDGGSDSYDHTATEAGYYFRDFFSNTDGSTKLHEDVFSYADQKHDITDTSTYSDGSIDKIESIIFGHH